MKRNNNSVEITQELRSAVKTIKTAILQSQARAIQMINQEQLSLYYGIGRYVSEHSRKGYWGTGAIGTISKQLKSELPGLKGFSEENIKLMRRFYEAWKDIETNSVVGTTEITDFNNSEQSANSVVETTDLQKADSEAESQRNYVMEFFCRREEEGGLGYRNVTSSQVNPGAVAELDVIAPICNSHSC